MVPQIANYRGFAGPFGLSQPLTALSFAFPGATFAAASVPFRVVAGVRPVGLAAVLVVVGVRGPARPRLWRLRLPVIGRSFQPVCYLLAHAHPVWIVRYAGASGDVSRHGGLRFLGGQEPEMRPFRN